MLNKCHFKYELLELVFTDEIRHIIGGGGVITIVTRQKHLKWPTVCLKYFFLNGITLTL